VDAALQSAIPVLLADAREQDQFRILDVIATVQGVAFGSENVTYGNIAVEGDVPGAEVFVEGDLAGRVPESDALLIENIPAGAWTVSIRDFSGRMASRSVTVDAGQTADSRMELMRPAAGKTSGAFVLLGSNPEGFEERWRLRDGAIVVRIPEGPFLMGSEHPQSEADERPVHPVVVDEFLIDKTEVTWRQYAKFARSEGHALPPAPMWGQLPHYPLSFATWEEAAGYCQWVGGRLPTEAEWEKAARGTDGRDYPWGNAWDPTRCNSISGGMHRPQPVGSYHGCVSPYGVLDMAGSHWQWVADWYGADYYAHSPERNPQGPATGSARVKRGGFWMNHPTQVRATHRGKSEPDWRNAPHGFRCAHDGTESGE
jgi:formylglycine-generating enzyme required for sulfatase activity